MRRLILFLIVALCFAFTLLPAGRLDAERESSSQTSAVTWSPKSTRPIDILKNTAKRTLETLKGMIFKGDEGGKMAQKREEIMREKVEETKAASVAEGSSR